MYKNVYKKHKSSAMLAQFLMVLLKQYLQYCLYFIYLIKLNLKSTEVTDKKIISNDQCK